MSTKSLTFITPNGWKHEEVRRLLASVDVHWSRVALPSPAGLSLEDTARGRAAAGFAILGAPCFVENTELFVETEEHGLSSGMRGGSAKRLLEGLGEEGFCVRFAGLAASARIVVALALGPQAKGATVFEGSLDGSIALTPKGEDGYGWDRVFVPEGFRRTLSELGTAKHLVNMRAAPYLELADHVLGRSFGGSFEAHITVAAEGRARADAFAALCDTLGVKCVEIELPSGDVPIQPMTATYHRGTLRDVQGEVTELARTFLKEGFPVTRTKIEAHGRNGDVPATNEDAAALPPQNYFEFHVKVVVPKGASLDGVSRVSKSHDAHLSRNASVVRPDGSEERFVTLRVHHLGRDHSEARFQALLDDLSLLGFPLKNRLREYTVYDSNVALDRGWA